MSYANIFHLTEWTPQETMAYKKAKEERVLSLKKLENPDELKLEKDASSMPDTSIRKVDVNGSASSW